MLVGVVGAVGHFCVLLVGVVGHLGCCWLVLVVRFDYLLSVFLTILVLVGGCCCGPGFAYNGKISTLPRHRHMRIIEFIGYGI